MIGKTIFVGALLLCLPTVQAESLSVKVAADRQSGEDTIALNLLLEEVASLRLAIADLRETFGERYSGGRNYLKRLELIESRLNPATAKEREMVRADFARLKRKALLANPLVSAQPILFVVRRQYRPDHHNTATFFPNAAHEYNNGAFTGGGALKLFDLGKSGAVEILLQFPEGVARDPEVHFSGRKIVFSLRRDARDSYHIYEVNCDGTGLKQLTFARDVDDLDPLYLPDDSIVFSSTREPKYCMCNRHIMANLFRMDADGANIHQIGKSTLFEGHGSLMPDGRILYDRWEYVDRNFGDAQALWTVNPDGSDHALYWGNNTASPGAVIDARIIPGTGQAVCVFGSCHDRPWGALALIDPALGLDGRPPVVRTWPAEAIELVQRDGWEIFDAFTRLRFKYEDPYPLSEKYFLCSRMTGDGERTGLYLLDVFGNEIRLHSEPPGCFDPMPLGPRTRPAMIAQRRDFESQEGYFYVADVYQGASMAGVKPGTVKYLRVVESPEKRFWTEPSWGGQGQEAPAMNWHDFNNKRILGTVPVEVDGSASFAAPAEKFVYFQLLDDNGMMIQSMRSGTMIQPGERASCIGCHEDHRRVQPPENGNTPRALRRSPDRLNGWHGPPRLFNYMAEVQPVLNRHCLSCHDFGQEAGDILNLAPDRGLVFNTSYNELWRRGFIKAIGAGPSDAQQAYTWGSHASKLVSALRREHCRVKLTPEEFDRVVTWIDINAPYYPTYASAYPENLSGRSPLNNGQLERLEQLTGVPLRQLASHTGNRGPQISFDRPKLSPCLAKISDRKNPDYMEALAIIRAGKEMLARRPEADGEGFQPCPLDQWREEKYLTRQAAEQRSRAAIRKGEKVYDQRGESF